MNLFGGDMTSGTHDHVHGRCGQLSLVKKTLLRGLLIDALVLGVMATMPSCGDDLVATCDSSMVMIVLGRSRLRGVFKFLEAGSFRGLLLKVLLRYPNVVKEGTFFLGVMLDVILQKRRFG